jgi:hypothetical protein
LAQQVSVAISPAGPDSRIFVFNARRVIARKQLWWTNARANSVSAYELVELESSFAAIEIEHVNQQFGSVGILGKCVPSVRHGCDEKSSYS